MAPGILLLQEPAGYTTNCDSPLVDFILFASFILTALVNKSDLYKVVETNTQATLPPSITVYK